MVQKAAQEGHPHQAGSLPEHRDPGSGQGACYVPGPHHAPGPALRQTPDPEPKLTLDKDNREILNKTTLRRLTTETTYYLGLGGVMFHVII